LAGGRDEGGEERVEGYVGQGEELAGVGDGEVDVCYWVRGQVVQGGGDVAGLWRGGVYQYRVPKRSREKRVYVRPNNLV